MTIVTKDDVRDGARRLGILETDSVLIHSSLKSLGYVEGGADAVIDGFYEALSEGTLIFPTLCQKDFRHAYETWHMDKESDVGHITNVFRKREGAYRSNQATHSVAAMGKDAIYLTKTHGESGKRFGNYGETPFAADSPWEKMYKMNTKIVFLGVGMLYCTFRHYAEYVFVNESLEKIKNLPEHDEMKKALWLYGGPRTVWPHLKNEELYLWFKEQGLVTETTIGEAKVICVESKIFVDKCLEVLEEADNRYLWDVGICYEETLEWMKKLKELKGKC